MKNVNKEKRGIVNIINFIRGVEPRCEIELLEPVVKQLELAKKHKLPVTWLMQYDAFMDRKYSELLKDVDGTHEIGIWLEIVQPLVEKAGIKWRGRYSWDWHTDVGFSVGYSPEKRMKIIDILMEDFQKTFGYLPRSAGSWFIDALTLSYLSDKYGITASCNCRDQWGTDGYTLWGGYLNQAYYPSKLNSYMPAQNIENQIPVPVFRMLGSDPIHQYEAAIGDNGQAVVTLEPVYEKGGGDPRWTDWFFKETFETPCLSFGYAQAGQENSFGWPRMKKGLEYQFKRLEEMRNAGKIRVETLAGSGEWFKATYMKTPASAVVAESDLDCKERGVTWYCSNQYRGGILWNGKSLRIRNIQIFNEKYQESFLHEVCRKKYCTYDTLPVMDGFLWSSPKEKAGWYPVSKENGKQLSFKNPPEILEKSESVLECRFILDDSENSPFVILFEEESIKISGPESGWAIAAEWDSASQQLPSMAINEKGIDFKHNGFAYSVDLISGIIRLKDNGRYIMNPGTDRILHISMRQ